MQTREIHTTNCIASGTTVAVVAHGNTSISTVATGVVVSSIGDIAVATTTITAGTTLDSIACKQHDLTWTPMSWSMLLHSI